ncbi:MAG: carboxypeptidase-like regulatory domain-containing protein [Bacteroidales bacterium]|nr:carboxypeptidase-like regulatory domain-containing protein [Bacteroidales bacterium]
MDNGKKTCQYLQAIRDEIASENDIVLGHQECTHKGGCLGTCPYCEGEVRYLESELGKRIRMGKAVTVAGITMALASTGTAAAQVEPMSTTLQGKVVAPRQTNELQRLKLGGLLVDNRSGKPVEDAHVALLQDGKLVAATLSDSTGRYELDVLTTGSYTLNVNAEGYFLFTMPVDLQQDSELPAILLSNGAPPKTENRLLGEPAVQHTFKCDTARSSVGLVKKERRCNLKVNVIDEKSGDPLPLVSVTLMRGDSVVVKCKTDFDGMASMKPLYGTYDIHITHYAYEDIVIPDVMVECKNMELQRVLIRDEKKLLGMPLLIEGQSLNRIGTDAPTQVMEREGVKLIVK